MEPWRSSAIETFLAGPVMPQTVLFKGYTVSGVAHEQEGCWHAYYIIEKDKRLVVKAGFILSRCAISAAENAALLRALQWINQRDED
jgi:hypothetical protein